MYPLPVDIANQGAVAQASPSGSQENQHAAARPSPVSWSGNQLVPETSTRLYHLNAGGSFITFVVQFFDVDISAQFTIKGCLLLLKSRCLVALPQSKRGSWSWHHINHLYVYKLLTSPNFSIARTESLEQGLENVRAFHNKGDYPLFVPPTKTVIKKAFPKVFPKIKKSPTYSRWFQMNHLKN